jgi:hypothetical protein
MIRHAFLQALFELQRPGRYVELGAIAERMGLAGSERVRAKTCAHRMLKRGWVENRQREGDGSRETGVYRLTQAGAAALASGAHATQASGLPGQARNSRLQQRLWTAMRAMRKFDTADLAAVLVDAAAPAADRQRHAMLVLRYVRGLVRGGYCVSLRRAGGGARARYLLVRDTGPKAPCVRWRAHDVVDQNTGATYAWDAHEGQLAQGEAA